MKILLTGASGELGKELVEILKHHELITPTREELDLNNPKKIKNFQCDPEIVILNAAITNLEECEQNSDMCCRVNYLSVKRLVKKFPMARFIYISTTSIYRYPNSQEDGSKSIKNAYYFHKYLAEKEIPNHSLILRCNFLTKEFIKSIRKLEEPYGYSNIIFNFLSVQNTARIIKELIDDIDITGIYNLSGYEEISKYDLVKKIIKDKEVNEIEYDHIKLGLTKRPLNSTPNSEKIKQYIKTPFLNINDSITEVLNSI